MADSVFFPSFFHLFSIFGDLLEQRGATTFFTLIISFRDKQTAAICELHIVAPTFTIVEHRVCVNKPYYYGIVFL